MSFKSRSLNEISNRKLRVEGLEDRMLLAADLAAIGEIDRAPDHAIGDANGDGSFDEADLIDVFQSGKYETDKLADWDDGDWNGDRYFDSGDLVLAFRSGVMKPLPVLGPGLH